MNILQRLLLIMTTAALLPSVALAAPIDYRDWSLGQIVLIAQSIAFDEAKMIDLGESSTPGIRQVAMLISEDADIEDAGTKNAILIECGMHGREWYAAESCYWFVDHLLLNRTDPKVRDLLSNADIWVIPQSNPAGRARDDLNFGDPSRFAYVCDSGSDLGESCEADTDCTDGTCYTSGWRSNANTTSCRLGVDPARNFSSDWGYAPDKCEKKLCRHGMNHNEICTDHSHCSGGRCKSARMQYRGDQPFSEPETLNLRRFVNNHMISMATIVHANSQQIWNQWTSRHGATSFMTDELVAMNAAASALYPDDPSMAREGVGGGSGQFSAWLAAASDVAADLDFGTARNISTFYFELPVKDYAVPYRDMAGDGSNSFHPSGDEMEALWGDFRTTVPDPADAIEPLLSYVARQARSPQCPVDDMGIRLVAECESLDFGIVGAKIAGAVDEPGLLDYDASAREETLPGGRHQIVFAVQNFSASSASSSTAATVSISAGATPTPTTVPVSLLPGERATYQVAHFFLPGLTYEVEIRLDSDDFALNDTKVFKFRVPGGEFRRPLRRVFGSALLRPRPGRLFYRGGFPLDASIAPQKGLELRLYAHGVNGSGQQQANGAEQQTPHPGAVVLELPAGLPWWKGSRPEKGRWVYRDPKGKAGPVQQLRIQRHCRIVHDGKLAKKGKHGRRHEREACSARVSFRLRDKAISSLMSGPSQSIELVLRDDALVFSSLTTGRSQQLPPRALLPEDEVEDEPHTPVQGPNDAQ